MCYWLFMKKSISTKEQQFLQELLKNVRQESSLTQIDVAKRLGKHQSFVSKYENGERRLDLPELKEVCSSLGIKLVAFVKRFEKNIENLK